MRYQCMKTPQSASLTAPLQGEPLPRPRVRPTDFVNSRGNAVNGRSKADSTLRKRQGGHAAKTAPKAFGVANGFYWVVAEGLLCRDEPAAKATARPCQQNMFLPS